MDLFKPTKTDKRKTLISYLKQNAPSIYQSSVLRKKVQYEHELENLREQYKVENDEEKRKMILSHASEIKLEIEIYSV